MGGKDMAEPNSLDEVLAARRKDLISSANEREIDWQSKEAWDACLGGV
jgi:hypothetical protein